MPDLSEPSSQPQPAPAPCAGPFSQIALALLPGLACFLGGGTEKWAEGVIWTLVGFYLIVRPPRLSLGPVINGILLALVAVAAVAFLPAHWFFFPAWRTAMVHDLGISLPSTVSPQPWITAGALVSLIGGLCWFYLVATVRLDLRSARRVIRLFVSSIVFLAAIAILLYWSHSAFPFWINQRGFGPFPNRNQTGDLFGITAIVLLACGQDDIRRGRIRWIFWVLGLGILVAAVILNFSRAGMAILVGGSILWIIVVTLRQRSSARIALGVSFVLLLLTAILLLGGQTLERFRQWGMAGPGITADFRWKVFHDTFRLIHGSPWCGVGLGNFDAVFAIFRKESVNAMRALHPESDWLWLWAEAGWPAVLLVVAGAVLMVRHILPLQEGTNQRFRLAALIAAFIFAVHGLVDVSAHRLGTAFAAIFLFGLALHRPLRFKRSRVLPFVFRLAGIVLIVAGVAWAAATRSNLLLPGAVGVSSVKKLSDRADQGRDFNETIQLTNQALDWAPLDWQLYFYRALAEVATRQPTQALDDFRRARFLEPNSYEIPLAEGKAWLPTQPILTVTAWREALRKAGPHRAEVYSSMLTSATLQSPAVNRILEEVGLSEPDLALAYLRRLSGPAFQQAVQKLLQKEPNLSLFSDPQKLALFDMWSERGDLEALAKTIEQHPEWLSYAWLGMANCDAQRKDFHAAYALTQRFGEAVAMPLSSGNESLEQLQQRYLANPDGYAVGYALYRAQIRHQRIDDALNTARHFSERPGSPAYFHFLEAQCWAAKQNWERAWEAWVAYRNAIRK
jgi:O-Antigen ligase